MAAKELSLAEIADIIDRWVQPVPGVKEVYLFGSRVVPSQGLRTDSLDYGRRSDTATDV